MIRAVVFDMDGLMFNSEDVYTQVGTEMLRRRGFVFGSELKDAMMGLPPRDTFQMMIDWHGLADTWQELTVESNGLFKQFMTGHLAPMPGLVKLLDALEGAGVPKAIATSSARELVTACLGTFTMEARFQFVLAAEDITRGKPDPEIYLTAATRFGIPPAEMLVLEDSHNGCRAAAAAGAYTVAVPGEHSRSQDFSVATLIIPSLCDRRLYEALGLPQPC